MTPVPRLSIGLPVYNGENYLAASLDALLGQSYTDFELIISDNASVDGTAEICRQYAKADPRISYLRLSRNIGATPNHNLLLDMARGELFKWASHDDLYGRDLLARCIEALDAMPHMILAHSWQALIDGSGAVTVTPDYPHKTDSDVPSERFRSLLFESGGDDFYGVVRTDVLRLVTPMDSYHHADRTYVAELALFGPFYQVPELLYFRRDHPDRAERAHPSTRSRCANLDPRRGNRFIHPTARLRVETVLGFISGIRRAPLSSAERRRCLLALNSWLLSHVHPGPDDEVPARVKAAPDEAVSIIDSVVPGGEVKSA